MNISSSHNYLFRLSKYTIMKCDNECCMNIISNIATYNDIHILVMSNNLNYLSKLFGNAYIDKLILLISYCNKYNIKFNYFNAFQEVCINGHLENTTWLIDYFIGINMKIDVNLRNDNIFNETCKKGHLEIVKLLIKYANKTGQIIDIHADYSHLFFEVCSNGYIEILKLLYDYELKLMRSLLINKYTYTNTNIIKNRRMMCRFDRYDNCFTAACQNGHLEVVQWLIEHENDRGINWMKRIDNKINYVTYFKHICSKGYLDMAKMLLAYILKDDIQILYLDASQYILAIRNAYNNHHNELTKWLIEYGNEIGYSIPQTFF